ncbi:MAG: phosphohistidine phosphatase SixA [Thermoplasmata archaeon]|nr:phosphohistidine phosphatase SixA [Candidatus Sysuiplasma jiujiangense]
MEMFIMRHGEAGKRLSVSKKDSERPLTVPGRKEIEEIYSCIRRRKYRFDIIAASPLKRAHETAALIGSRMRSASVEDWEELRPEGSRAVLYARLSKLNRSSRILIVGHEPYLSSMIGDIICNTCSCRISLKKTGLAKISVASFTPKIEGRLRWLLTPGQIKRMD